VRRYEEHTPGALWRGDERQEPEKKRQENKNLVMVRSEVVTSVVFVDAAGSETSVHSSAVHFLSPTTLSG
jgi:hypothetical protein